MAQVAHNIRVTVSEFLRLLTKNERPWANSLGLSPKMSDCDLLTHYVREPLFSSDFDKICRAAYLW